MAGAVDPQEIVDYRYYCRSDLERDLRKEGAHTLHQESFELSQLFQLFQRLLAPYGVEQEREQELG